MTEPICFHSTPNFDFFFLNLLFISVLWSIQNSPLKLECRLTTTNFGDYVKGTSTQFIGNYFSSNSRKTFRGCQASTLLPTLLEHHGEIFIVLVVVRPWLHFPTPQPTSIKCDCKIYFIVF